MINKIKNATVKPTAELTGTDNEVGALVTGTDTDDNADAKSTADLAGAVALKAMTKTGKFNAVTGEVEAIKEIVASAVNKVLGAVEDVIKKTVNLELGKIKDAIKGIKYSETTGTNATETTNSTK